MKTAIRPRLFFLIGLSFLLMVSGLSAKTPITRYQDQISGASLQPGRFDGQSGVVVIFEGTNDLHYYATSAAAPAPGLELTITAAAEGLSFGQAVYPAYSYFDDPVKGKIEVYVGNFKVFVPITTPGLAGAALKNVTVTIKGIACTSQLCLAPFTEKLYALIDFSDVKNWPVVDFQTAPPRTQTNSSENAAAQVPTETPRADSGLGKMLANYRESGTDQKRIHSTGWFFLLAVLAGLSINIMPCVLPVIPLIIMRLVRQAAESGPKRVALGFSFCGGIVLFFAAFAVISAIIQLATGAALDLNSLYRNPAATITLFLFIVLFALALLDVVTFTLPSSVAASHGGSSGFAGSVGMGFFAGILSTPCSGALIGAVLVWAQTQPLIVSTISLVLMGIGMALPYAALVSVPKLLDFVPKPGTWMEIFKKTGGFLLLLIAAKFMLAGLTKEHLLNVLLYGVIFAFCVWMWGTWVTFSTPKTKKWTVRGIAAVVAVAAGLWLLPAPQPPRIDWQEYDAAQVQKALEQNKPVLVKFTADWCTNCKIVDKNVYQNPDIAAFLDQKGFVTIKADTTQADYKATVDYKAIFKESGNVPNTILLNPNTGTMTKIRGIFTPDELKQTIMDQF